jgi:ankyrin
MLAFARKSFLLLAGLLAPHLAFALSPVYEEGLTPLHHAARLGHVDQMVELLQQGARIDAVTSFGRTPLALALDSGEATAAFVLAARGALVRNAMNAQPISMDASGLALRPFHEALGVLEALDRGGMPWSALGRFDQNILHALAQRQVDRAADAFALIEWLKAKGLDVDSKDTLTGTPLHIAIRRGDEKMTLAFIDAGASLSIRGARGHDALAEALRERNGTLAALLIERGARLDAVDAKGNGAMYWAAYGGNPECIRLLQRHGVDVHSGFAGGASALHVARSQAAVSLFLAAGVPLDARDDAGRTPLFVHVQHPRFTPAAGRPNPEATYEGERYSIIRMLLEKGADPKARDASGREILELTYGRVTHDVAALFRERGVSHGAED